MLLSILPRSFRSCSAPSFLPPPVPHGLRKHSSTTLTSSPPSSESCLSKESGVVSHPGSPGPRVVAGCWYWRGWMDEALVRGESVSATARTHTNTTPHFLLLPPLSLSLSLSLSPCRCLPHTPTTLYLTASSPCCQALTTNAVPPPHPPPCLRSAGWMTC